MEEKETKPSLEVPLLARWLRWLGVASVATVILYYSTVSSPPTSEAAVASAVGEGEAASSSDTTSVGSMLISVINHVVGYALLSWCTAYATSEEGSTRSVRWGMALKVIAAATVYGAAVEIIQLRFPDRVFDLRDIVMNSIGAASVLIWYILELRVNFKKL